MKRRASDQYIRRALRLVGKLGMGKEIDEIAELLHKALEAQHVENIKLTPLLIEAGPSKHKHADLVRKHSEGLAREIQSDVMAKEDELADAIERGIRRFARPEWQ